MYLYLSLSLSVCLSVLSGELFPGCVCGGDHPRTAWGPLDSALAETHNNHNGLQRWSKVNEGVYFYGDTQVCLPVPFFLSLALSLVLSLSLSLSLPLSLVLPEGFVLVFFIPRVFLFYLPYSVPPPLGPLYVYVLCICIMYMYIICICLSFSVSFCLSL